MSTLEISLLASDGIDNHKPLHFQSLTASFHLHSRVIKFSTLKQTIKIVGFYKADRN
jgi:hypothetical protein